MREVAEAYARLLEALTADSLDDLRAVATPDVHFRDPFNDVHGVDRMIAAFGHAFTAADDVRFTVHDTALSGTTAYLRWTFVCRPRALKAPLEIEGMSEVRFDAHGRVTAHLDYWDAGQGFYERIPVLGGVLRRVRRRLAV